MSVLSVMSTSWVSWVHRECHEYIVSVMSLLWVSWVHRECHEYIVGVVSTLWVSWVHRECLECHEYIVIVMSTSWVSWLHRECHEYIVSVMSTSRVSWVHCDVMSTLWVSWVSRVSWVSWVRRECHECACRVRLSTWKQNLCSRMPAFLKSQGRGNAKPGMRAHLWITVVLGLNFHWVLYVNENSFLFYQIVSIMNLTNWSRWEKRKIHDYVKNVLNDEQYALLCFTYK